ncbi:MAG: diaminopimelate epimerase [Planctomycetales bacterium]|nr:diaminopimelate epimerase [Planctomycetales bacterium]
MRFVKMHGAENDYVCVDGFRDALPENPAVVARLISDRHRGIGSDGLILICPTTVADAEMRMFNADGSEAEMCGNGIRCVAKYLFDEGIATQSEIAVLTRAGLRKLQVFSEQGSVHSVRVDMGAPELTPSQIPTKLRTAYESSRPIVRCPLDVNGHQLPVTCISMGNPHCVVYVDECDDVLRANPDQLLSLWGPRIETHECFPDRVNVHFVTVESPFVVKQRTWERGSGETMACGTGASAVCVAGVLAGRSERRVTVHVLGGELRLQWDEVTNHVFMTGPADEVFRGEVNLAQLGQ